MYRKTISFCTIVSIGASSMAKRGPTLLKVYPTKHQNIVGIKTYSVEDDQPVVWDVTLKKKKNIMSHTTRFLRDPQIWRIPTQSYV